MEGGNTGGTGNPSNIYVWMLGKSRPELTQPAFASVNAGGDQTLNLANGSMVLNTNSVSFNGATINLNGSASAARAVLFQALNGLGGR